MNKNNAQFKGLSLEKLFVDKGTKVLPILQGVANTPLPILVEGRNGTGKSTIGLLIEELSSQTASPKKLYDECWHEDGECHRLKSRLPDFDLNRTIFADFTFTKEFIDEVGDHIRIKCFRDEHDKRYFHIISEI